MRTLIVITYQNDHYLNDYLVKELPKEEIDLYQGRDYENTPFTSDSATQNMPDGPFDAVLVIYVW